MKEWVGGVVDVEGVSLHVLAVISLEWVETEQPLLELRIKLVPNGGREADQLKPVADPGDAILCPSLGLGTRQSIREIPPGVAVG